MRKTDTIPPRRLVTTQKEWDLSPCIHCGEARFPVLSSTVYGKDDPYAGLVMCRGIMPTGAACPQAQHWRFADEWNKEQVTFLETPQQPKFEPLSPETLTLRDNYPRLAG